MVTVNLKPGEFVSMDKTARRPKHRLGAVNAPVRLRHHQSLGAGLIGGMGGKRGEMEIMGFAVGTATGGSYSSGMKNKICGRHKKLRSRVSEE